MLESDRAAVAAYQRHIIATEGPRTVAGTFYARESDATRYRLWAAERMVREAHREAAHHAASAAAARTPDRRSVGTWLTQRERDRVNAATAAYTVLTHRETLDALRADLITGRIDALLLSAARIVSPNDTLSLGEIVRDFPGTPVVGMICETDERQAIAATLSFGLAGVCAVVDARTPNGWATLRGAFDPQRVMDSFAQRAVRELTHDTSTGAANCTTGWARFLAAAFSPQAATTKEATRVLGVVCSTLTSRFYRVGLPSPKRYIATARLVRAARLAESPGLSLAAIANRIEASSPQSFGRTVRMMTGMPASQFRERYDGDGMLERFRLDLVEPYRETLRSFDPLASTSRDRDERRSARAPRAARGSRRRLSVAGRAA